MHLTEIGLQNIRLFKEKTRFSLAPITLFTGPNNSGKSTIIKTILLLKDTFAAFPTNTKDNKHTYPDLTRGEHNFPTSLIFNNNSKHYLGGFENLKSKKDKQKEIKILLPFLLPELKNNYNGWLELDYGFHNDSNHLRMAQIFCGKIRILKLAIRQQKDNKLKLTVTINYSYLEGLYEQGEIEFIKVDKDIRSYDLEYGFSSLSSDEIKIPGILESQDGELDESSFIEFGYAEFPYRHKLSGGDKRFFELHEHMEESSNNKESDQGLHIEESAFRNGIQNSKGDLRFDYVTRYTRVTSIMQMLSDAFEEYHRKRINNKDSKTAYSYLGDQNILRWLNSEGKSGRREHFWYSNFGLLIIGLLDRAISFNLEKYTKIFMNSYLYPSMDMRFEQLITENDGEVFNVLSEFKKIEKQSKKLQEDQLLYTPFRFIDLALSYLGLGESIDVELIKNYGYEIILDSENGKIPLKDCGYGIRKIITLIIRIAVQAQISISEYDWEYISFKPSLIMIEEPEANLHPLLQSRLADLFALAALKFNIQFIIETHSEYLVRRFQSLVVKDHMPIKYNSITIKYFYPAENIPDGESQVKEMRIRPDGILKDDFGPGFFDEALKLALELLDHQRMN